MKRITVYYHRYSRPIAIVTVFLCMAGLLLLQAIAINRIAENAQQRTEQIKDLSKQMDCIAKFFSQKNRDNKSIAEINQCRIDTKTSNKSVLNDPAPAPKPSTTQQPTQSNSKTANPIPKSTSKPTSNKPTKSDQPSDPERSYSVRKIIEDTVGGILR